MKISNIFKAVITILKRDTCTPCDPSLRLDPDAAIAASGVYDSRQ